MTLTIDLTGAEEQKLRAVARAKGMDPSTFAKDLIAESLLNVTPEPIDDTDPLVLMLRQKIAKAPTDPSEIKLAEDDLLAFMRKMNQDRIATGASILYPDAV